MSGDLQHEIVRLLDAVGKKAEDPMGGITRLLYTAEWVDSQMKLKDEIEGYGLRAYFDAIGNLYGRLEADASSRTGGETILTGSHVDTVRNGGKYDGMFGIIAGILAIRYLKEKYGKPLRNIEVVSFAEEEGSRFPFVFWGSKNFLGLVKQEEVENVFDHDGISLAVAMHRAGFGFQKENHERRADVKAFVEIHVEQGNVLEREQKKIGIVNSIAGQRRFSVELTGTANHAGTTPMEYRQDTLFAASKMIAGILGNAKLQGRPLVATAGFIEVKPNIVNVVPGNTNFSLDIRHTDSGILKQFSDESVQLIYEIAKECDVAATVDMWMNESPVPMDDKLVACLENVCKKMNLDYKIMHSGAGHDSQLIAKHIPTAMLFVPSKDGISHNPSEFTEPELLTDGVLALVEALYQLAYVK